VETYVLNPVSAQNVISRVLIKLQYYWYLLKVK